MDKIPDKNSPMLKVIQYWAPKGLSDRSIAVKCGTDLASFYEYIENTHKGVKVLKLALENGRADFEALRIEAKDAIMNDPETANSLKYKIVREDLKTLTEWAPATRAISVHVEAGPTQFQFESFSENELEQIALKSAAADNNNKKTDGNEEITKD